MVTATSITAETGCEFEPGMGVMWEDDFLPLAPAEAVVEWLERERCAVCGRQGVGCVQVDNVTLFSDDDDNPVLEELPLG